MELADYEKFPKATDYPEGMKLLRTEICFTELNNMAEAIKENISREDFVYSALSGEEQKLSVFMPNERKGKLPLIVYIPGSGWMRQGGEENTQYMYLLANRGFVVARALYRPSEIAPFPAQVTDSKNAIKYMMKNAEKYGIDTENIGIMGDSSGGHTAAFIALTGNGFPVDEELYPDIRIKIKCVVDWFGPTDIYRMNDDPCCIDFIAPDSMTGMLIGGKNVSENKELADKASPIYYVNKETEYPPMLIMHGNMDAIVPFNQSVRFYNAMKSNGKDVEFYCVDGAGHWEKGFHSKETVRITVEFLEKHLKG